MNEPTLTTLSSAQLAALNYDVPPRFILRVDPSQTLTVQSVLRIVPGKRLVVKARYKNEDVIAKVFFLHQHLSRAVEREKAGYGILKNKGITTPEKLAELKSANEQSIIFIYRYIKPPASLDINTFRLKVVERIVEMHQLGVLQDDLHMDNFLAGENEVIWVIDPAAIRENVNTNQLLENIALFIAQLPLTGEDNRKLLLAAYLNQLYPDNEEKLLVLHQLIQNKWQVRKKQYLKKIFRNCTDYKMHVSGDHSIIVRRNDYESLQVILQNLECQISPESLLKDGNSSTVFRIESDGKFWVVKRYNYKNFWIMLKRIIRTSRAKRSWYFAHLMKIMGVATPAPVACVEKKVLGLVICSYYICEYVEGEDLLTSFSDKNIVLTPLIRRLFQAWKLAMVSHGDLKATNFICSNGELQVIDFDAMKEFKYQTFWRIAIDKDVSRLLRNWSNPNLVSPLEKALFDV